MRNKWAASADIVIDLYYFELSIRLLQKGGILNTADAHNSIDKVIIKNN